MKKILVLVIILSGISVYGYSQQKNKGNQHPIALKWILNYDELEKRENRKPLRVEIIGHKSEASGVSICCFSHFIEPKESKYFQIVQYEEMERQYNSRFYSRDNPTCIGMPIPKFKP